MPGVQELIVIFLIVVVLFGASRLPQLGRGLGEGISNFKKGLKGADEGDDEVEGQPPSRQTRAQPENEKAKS